MLLLPPLLGLVTALAGAASPEAPASGLALERPIQPTAFFDVVGRRAAAVGYEGHGFEVWVHPLQVARDVRLSFKLAGYPLDIEGATAATRIEVRPESTTFIYSHAAFTVKQTLVAPIDEPAIVMQLEVRSVLPLTVFGSFRPRLKLMWPAGLMTQNVEWKDSESVYYLTEEAKKFVGILGGPLLKDLSVMPYQEEPRDVPVRFSIEPPRGATTYRTWVLFTAAVGDRESAKAAYDRIAGSIPVAVQATADHYRRVLDERTAIATPDPRIDRAFAWAAIGVDKGFANNPTLGTGLIAGFRTAGESERPGFAWFFGRDALWTSLALSSTGDFGGVRTALDFLRKYQRADGKIPHEISQSASFIPWFTDYKFPWNATDATPLYVIAHADLWRSTGDDAYLGSSWDSLVKAFRHAASTDADGNGLLDNTTFGHGWVEGGALYPPHEEYYLQGVWIEACRSMTEMAAARGESGLAAEARAAEARTREAAERTYWLEGRGFYAFATMTKPPEPRKAEPGPHRERRTRRMAFLDSAKIVDEDTVLPAVPLWFGHAEEARAQSQIDHLGGASLTTDWGQRLLSNRSELYDPISYHYGSVWPLFTGWTSMAAYRYGRPHVGFQAAMANVLLSGPGALGYVTELLSGDSLYPFGRSSHHQIWSEAMVITPLVRGLLGVEVRDAGSTLRVAPQLPASWDHTTLRRVAVGAAKFDVAIRRPAGRYEINVSQSASHPAAAGGASLRLDLSPGLPLDAKVRSVTAGGQPIPFKVETRGDRRFVLASLPLPASGTTTVIELDEGTDVEAVFPDLRNGDESTGIRILRSRASDSKLDLVLEGLGGRSYLLRLRTPKRPVAPDGASVTPRGGSDYHLNVTFEGAGYVRREITIGLQGS